MHPRGSRPRPVGLTTRTPIGGADLGREIAVLRADLESIVGRLDLLASLTRRSDLLAHTEVVDGPFVGDAPAAMESTRLWVERTRLMLTSPTDALSQAHISAGGLAVR